MNTRICLVWLGLLLTVVFVNAQVPPQGTVLRPALSGKETIVVPDRFVRSWDPVTVFFSEDVGKKAGSSEDSASDYVQFEPEHPGAFTWIDRRTLQFRPADPWSPLTSYRWRIGKKVVDLTTLMTSPTSSLPENGSEGLDPVDAITLVFDDPVEPEDLARLLSIELRPLPGVSQEDARWLHNEDFTVKTVERSSPGDPAAYVLALDSPIGFSTRAIVHFRLSLEDDAERPVSEISCQTAEPFRVVSVGSRTRNYPLAPQGSRYAPDQALDAGPQPVLVVRFSSQPQGPITPIQARRLVRFSPAVEGLEYSTAGRDLEILGRFDRDTLYRVEIAPSPISDAAGRSLEVTAASELYVFFPRQSPYLRWQAAQGVVERYGPKMVPVGGRGHDRFDLRMFPVDPLDRSFWPFPERPVVIDEGTRPPGPGEVSAPFTRSSHIREYELLRQLEGLGSPPVSEIVELPLRRDGGSATFGLDLSAELKTIGGSDSPGHYLVGLRALDAGAQRAWMRLQVTDLCLTVVEEAHEVRFFVTSLSTGLPVEGAELRVEAGDGNDGSDWRVLANGVTGADGAFRWVPSGCRHCSILRLVVQRAGDVLVLDPTRAPDVFHDGAWSASGGTWLQWTTGGNSWRGEQPTEVSHVFTERPVYRPDESVYIKGWFRERANGRLRKIQLERAAVVVLGPGDLEWRFPVETAWPGSFNFVFEGEDRPTGEYSVHLEGWRPDADRTFYSSQASFRLEAYRIPRFQVDLHAPDRITLDGSQDISLTATYYAGGRVEDRPVEWQVTQFPYTWTPSGFDGFLLSSDARFAATNRFETSGVLHREDRTDVEGSASLVIDPTIEQTAAPRTYVVEATVTGADDQTVTSTRRIVALPPFALGLKVPRYLEHGQHLEPQVLALGWDDEPLTGVELTVRLKHRQWHSYLQASDFSDGEARYITDIVDETVHEETLVSADRPLALRLPIEQAGVYVVELEARDRLGRAQVVAADLYAGGTEPVAWSKPSAGRLRVTADRDRYDPGDVATFVVESPFQSARTLVIVEAPEGNRYRWLPVRNGTAALELNLESTWAPRVPVHFVLMRGRVPGTGPMPGNSVDLGKPATVATTSWVEVNPRAHQLGVELQHPERALPGQEIQVTVTLADPDGRPLPGEVTLWLVDQAVLALGSEARLDPLPDFITNPTSHLDIRDTRDMPFGLLPFSENPGGGEGAEEALGLLDRATVRRNFQPVPFYDPTIVVGDDGRATVTVALPDNLTNFKLRAKAASGLERFGYATGHLAVRLPVIVQPALPRFVRPGDTFTAAAIGRVVEGEGGPGAAEVVAEGVIVDGPSRYDVAWVPNEPERIEFDVSVPSPSIQEDGTPERTEAVFKVAVERLGDGASDAFEVRLPFADDRRRTTQRLIQELVPGEALALPEVKGDPRPGSVRRRLVVSSRPGLVRMMAGLSFLMDYPFGCTEQRLSRAGAWLGLGSMRNLLPLEGAHGDLDRSVENVLDWIPEVVDSDGLVAYWPGADGYVSLTAWSLDFLSEVRAAGYVVDPELTSQLETTLDRALRSDYGHFIDGEAFAERCWALAALARAGRFDPAYAAELARKAQFLSLEATAQVVQSFIVSGAADSSVVDDLVDQLWRGIVFRLHQGEELYGGLQAASLTSNPLILPSETRTLAEVTRALAAADSGEPRFEVLVNGLVNLGRGDGWGTTNANAAALHALADTFRTVADGGDRSLSLVTGTDRREMKLNRETPVVSYVDTSAIDSVVTEIGERDTGPATTVWAETSWVPEAPGSETVAEANGFVVTRELLHYRTADAPPSRQPLETAGQIIDLEVGDVLEEHINVVNPADRHFVAIVVPLAAGLEILNPMLATAPPEAASVGRNTVRPTYADLADDRAAFYFDSLPKGSYDLYFRTRATIAGRFVQPAAAAEMMYDASVWGMSNGAWVHVGAGASD